MLVTTNDLTNGERLKTQRRRNDETLEKAAKRLKLSVSDYAAYEADKKEGGPNASVGKLAANEQCYIMRLRSGKTLLQVSKAIKRCRLWTSRMEHGEVNCDLLTEYWSK